jgi:23S rRNA-/tRNA-specific pseudouridylate synthase
VHFSSIGHPIFADSLYGTASPDLEGQALHAYRLSFAHPVTGKPLTVTAPLKPDFLKVLKDYGFEVF